MEMIELVSIVYARFIVFALVFLRIGSMLWSFNLFRRELITGKIILTLGSVLSLYVMMLDHSGIINYDIFSIKMLINASLQVFIGFVGGLILNIVFDVFLGLGQVISTQIGLGLASLIDPRLGSITSLAHFYMIAASLIFLFLNGHLFIIKTIIQSFDAVPLNKQFIPQSMMSDALNYSSIIFSGAIMLSITIVMTMLMTNIALAVMTKFAPQFNIFSVGINITLIMGLICIYITFNLMMGEGVSIIQQGLNIFQNAFYRMK
jgi:flagellar biosynthesis protein FliR